MDLPKDFLDMLAEVLPKEEVRDFMNAIDEEATTSIRVHHAKSVTPHWDGEDIPWSRDGKKLHQRPVFTMDPLFHGGGYYVQDASSQILEQVFRKCVQEGPLRVLDLCAAPGGKSTHISSLLSNDSLLVSNEVIAKRSHILKENIIKWGRPNVVVTQKEAWQFADLEEYFDVILVDAPCSGEGLFRKDPHAIDEWSSDLVDHSTRRQRRILGEIWKSLKPGGVLIYSTCTYNKYENEENVEWLHEELGAEVLAIPVDPSWKLHTRSVGTGNCVRFFPQDDGGEGFCIAALRKQGEPMVHAISKKQSILPKKIQDTVLTSMLEFSEDYILYVYQGNIHAFPKAIEEDLARVMHLSPLYFGVQIAEQKGKVFVPSHPLAVSTIVNREAFEHVSLSYDEAISYLRKEPLSLNGAHGFALLTYEGLPIGFAKIIGNRHNNLYPTEWRIRM